MNRKRQSVFAAAALAFAGALPPGAAAQQADADAAELAELRAVAVSRAVDRVRDALVQVRAIGDYQTLSDNASGAATGVLLDQRWVLTSSFGFERRPEVLIVELPDGSTLSAALTSIDHGRQTALLRLAQKAEFDPVNLEPRSNPRPGETAIGVGAAYSAARPNVSVGVVSAASRQLGRAMQTDAAVSPANYGGLLIDLRARVFGLITPMAQQGAPSGGAGWYNSGIGFAIQLQDIKARLPRMQQGEDLYPGRAGIAFEKGSPLLTPTRVRRVAPQGPAEGAGVEQGDLITAVAGAQVANVQQLRIALGSYDAGDHVTLQMDREEQSISVDLELVAASELSEQHERRPSLLERFQQDPPQPE